MLFNQHRRKYWEHLLVRRFVLFGLLLFPLSQSANAEVVAADAILQVLVRVDSVVDSEVPVLPGSTQSAGVSQASDIEGVIRRASSAGAATLNDASSGTLSFSGAFQKLPTNLSGGFAATSGELVYRFETDVAGTLFLETANAASFQGFGGFDARAPSWALNNGTGGGTSSLNTTESWTINVQAGSHELVLNSASSGVAWAESSNASGQFSTVFNWGIGGLPGTLENPILPTELGPGDFGFAIVTTEDNRFYDPIIATGYDYVATDVPFASVLIPEALPNGDSEFQLLVGSQIIDLNAGDTFDLTTIASGGVSAFGIRGIDTSEMIDPNDPTAFVTGLSFAQGGVASSFKMTAVIVPEPSSCLAIGLFAGFAAIRRRRKRRATQG